MSFPLKSVGLWLVSPPLSPPPLIFCSVCLLTKKPAQRRILNFFPADYRRCVRRRPGVVRWPSLKVDFARQSRIPPPGGFAFRLGFGLPLLKSESSPQPFLPPHPTHFSISFICTLRRSLWTIPCRCVIVYCLPLNACYFEASVAVQLPPLRFDLYLLIEAKKSRVSKEDCCWEY